MKTDNLKLTLALLKRARDQDTPFSIHSWERQLGEFRKRILELGSGNIDHECGFAACVGGLMMNDPAHNAAGLTRNFGEPHFTHKSVYVYRGTQAIAWFWNITEYDARFVTDPGRYPIKTEPTISDAIIRIERLIEKYGSEDEIS